MSDLHPSVLDAYEPPLGVYDEMLGSDRVPRRHWESVLGSLSAMAPFELARRRAQTARLLADDGVTYHRYRTATAVGELGLEEVATLDSADRSRPTGDTAWRLDPVPVVLASDEWRTVEEGLIQRAELLDLVLTDLYGDRQLLHRRLLPPELVFGHPGYLRACHGMRLPGPHQLFTTAVDLARDGGGSWHVLADRTQAPSGAGYALENRTVVSRVFPSLYRDAQVHRLAPFFRALRSSLQEVAPPGTNDPRIVVLTPGPHSETAFEHAFVASYLGYPLVQGGDLSVRDGRVWMRTLERMERVDVILRRVDAAYSDPLELRPDSELGVPGLVEACRQGAVSVVNTLGSGVLENPALLAFLPRLAEALLGQELRLPSVPTWWCGEEAGRKHVLAHLDTLVLKPVARAVGASAMLGSTLSAAERDDLRCRVEADPAAWVGQEELTLASAPVLAEDGLAPRRMVLRTFLVSRRGSYAAMAGGLTRVAPEPGTAFIANQAGAWSKDTWILTSEPEAATGFWLQEGPQPLAAPRPDASISSRAGENLFWLARYAERVEDAVRLLRVVHDRRNEFQHASNPAGTACLTTLYQALTHITTTYPGFMGGEIEHPTHELASLVFDHRRAGTVAFSARRLLNAARAVRDQLSIDTWSVLAALERDLDDGTARGDDRTAVIMPTLTAVLQRLLALSGLEAESLVRDAGWRFQDAGRRIERAIHLASLLRVTLTLERDQATDSLLLESVLTAAESIITYRRRYRSKARLTTVLDLLLLDESNPRSLVYQLQRLSEDVANFPPSADGRMDSVARGVLGTTTLVRLADTATLATTSDDGTRPELEAFLWKVVEQLMATAGAIERTHFTPPKPQRRLA